MAKHFSARLPAPACDPACGPACVPAAASSAVMGLAARVLVAAVSLPGTGRVAVLSLTGLAVAVLSLTGDAAYADTASRTLIPIERLIRVPLLRQATDYTCGASALQSVFAYYGDEFREEQLARQLKTNSRYGTRYKEIARLSRGKGYSVDIKKDMTIDNLERWLDEKKPVICLIQAWADKPLDYSKDWDDGHYVVAVGYDERNVYFMDPCVIGNYSFIPRAEFLARWHDKDSEETLEHFGMVVSKDSSVYNPLEIKRTD